MNKYFDYAYFLFLAINVLIVYAFIVPFTGVELIQTCKKYFYCRRHFKLTFFGYLIDSSDNQWREFRGSLGILFVALIVITAFHYLLQLTAKRFQLHTSKTEVLFHLVVGISFVTVLHGYHALIILAILIIAFILGKIFNSSKYSIIFTWCFALLIIILKESYRVKHFACFQVFTS